MSERFDATRLPELGYNRDRDAYCVPYDADPVTTALLAVARLTGTDPMELPPLGETVDPEDIERYVRHRDAGRIPASTLTFTVADVEVTIADRSILLRENGSVV